jgi:hypothetical protein
MERVIITGTQIDIPDRPDLAEQVQGLSEIMRITMILAIQTLVQPRRSSIIGKEIRIPTKKLEELIAVYVTHDAGVQTFQPPELLEEVAIQYRGGTQAAALQAMGFDPVALGGKVVDGEVFKPDANPDDRGRCANCGRPGVWISGAGRYLCAEHQDDY